MGGRADTSRVRQFRLPDLGEGLTEGEILQWMVAQGDTITLNQPIVEVETAKAAVEVPSPYAGVVVAIHHQAGETVDVGAPIISVDTDPSAGPLEQAAGEAAAGAAANPVESAAPKGVRVDAEHPEVGDLVPPPPDDASGPQGALIGEVGPGGRTATLVGYGPKAGAQTRRPRADVGPTRPPQPAPGAAASDATEPPPATAARVSAAAVGKSAADRSAGGGPVRCKPPVRKLAASLGVDLTGVTGTGPDGVITRDDVQRAAQSAPTRPATAGDRAARERRVPIKGVRRHTAEAVAASAFTAPHVTEFLTVDVTPTMELRRRVAELPELAGVKVTPLLLVAKALLLAVRRHPEINASWDEPAQEIVVKEYVNLGIAAATPRGLMVPNVKDADALSLPELARALQDLTATAKQGRTPPADLQGGTITITNVGAFGVDNGTPILNRGEAAILCLGAVRPMPWVVDGEIAVRQVTQLALSFDHRLVDGQLGSLFLADVGRVLSDPTLGLVWG